MSKGILLFAFNNKIDYIKQACFFAITAKEFLNLPVSVVTDDISYASKFEKYFDNIVLFDNLKETNYKVYYNGTSSEKLNFKNSARCYSYDLTPYDETLVIDTDVLLGNKIFRECYNSIADFLIYDIAYFLNDIKGAEIEYCNDVGIKFYWATAFFFRKTIENKIFFDLLKHIQDNWNHYRFNYKIDQTYFRNDYAFSIAIHIMNGFGIGNFANPMPGKLYFLSDREYIVDYNKNSFLFLLQNKLTEHYFLNRTKDFNVHVLNKFSLDKIVNKNING
jgi:hypothetical protein